MNPDPSPPQIEPEALRRLAAVFALLMVVLAILWGWWAQGQNPLPGWYPLHQGAWSDGGLGLLLGGVGALAMWQLRTYLPAAQRLLEQVMRHVPLRRFSVLELLLLALLAGFPEEILFRGAMQPALGLLISAVIFAALHAINPHYFAYVLLVGIGLGLLAEWRGDLWLVSSFHFAYDAGLLLLARAAQSPGQTPHY